ncbi:MAG: 4Fe-4S dicluster domain-containing protein [Chloroflexota bacterium]|nr:4Fe-4S dicluster domain-containing protein [Dehalococcoidia bacterium]MDW8255009.1 4Fe-4S dicluster domain-containing protein [Chloroflexota bacterium]
MAERKRWGMVIDLDRCTGCQACVVACQAENNIPLNTPDIVLQARSIQWIRVERYWSGIDENDPAKVKVGYLPVLCVHCTNAPCEPVCPVYAAYHNPEGLNVQVYNRCVGTRYCANNCPYHARYFNYWEREWPEPLNFQLNPDVTIRSKGIMEKCTFCVQRIRRAERRAKFEGRTVRDQEFTTACAQACPTGAIVFGNLADPSSLVSQLAKDARHYRLLEHLGTEPGVYHLKKVDPNYQGAEKSR